MTRDSATISLSLVNRVRERAACADSQAGIPLIVLEELQAASLQIREEARLESAKHLLVAAYQSASLASTGSSRHSRMVP